MKIQWKNGNKKHQLFIDGQDTFVRVMFKPRLKHYGVYQATRYFMHRGALTPSYAKVTFGLTLEEAKASAAAIYLLTKE